MNITTLKIFIMVSDEHSFSSAGRKLFITPSAVIQKMQKLEQELGFTLFERNYTGVTLTEEGQAFYKGAQSILRTWEKTLNACDHCRQNRDNTINIGVHTPTLMSAYQTFVADHPQYLCKYIIYAETDVDRLFNDFMDGKLQIMEWPVLTKLQSQGLTFLPRYEAEICCIMKQDHPLSKRPVLTLNDLVDQPIMLYSHTNQEVIEEALLSAMEKNEIPAVNYSLIQGATNRVMEACRQGSVVLVSRAYAKQLPLKAVALTPRLNVTFGLAYKMNASSAVKEMIEFIRTFDLDHGVTY